MVDSQTINSTIWSTVVGGEITPRAKTVAKIRSFGGLQVGWHYGTGKAPPSWIVATALNYLYQLMMLGFSETDAFPGPDGQIMVTAYIRKHCIEVTVETDGTLTIAHQVDGHDVSFKPEVTAAQANLELGRIVGELEREKCSTFGWSILSIMIPEPVNFGSLHSAFPAPAVAPPFSMNNVESIIAAAHAYMPTGIIGGSVGTRLFSGLLTTVNSGLLAV